MLADFGLKRFLLAVWNDGGADRAVLAILAALQNAHDGSLVFAASAGDLAARYVARAYCGLCRR